MTDEIVVHREGSRVAILELVGEHDEYSAEKVAAAIDDLFTEGRHVVVDLRRTTFVDSTTVSQLLRANTAAGEARLGFAVVLSGSSGWPVRTMFELTHLDQVMAVEPTLAGAIKRIRARGSERRSSSERRTTYDRRQRATAAPLLERRLGGERRSGVERRATA